MLLVNLQKARRESGRKKAKKKVTLLKQFNQFRKVPLTVTTEAEAKLMYLLGNDKIKSIARECVFLPPHVRTRKV